MRMTAAAKGKVHRPARREDRSIHDPLFPINSWTDEEVFCT